MNEYENTKFIYDIEYENTKIMFVWKIYENFVCICYKALTLVNSTA